MAGRPFVYRFLRDLRVDDHAGLAIAASRGEILPVVVIDDALAGRLRASPRRAGFYCAALRALDGELRERGSHLTVRRGPAAASLVGLARATGAGGVAWSASYDAAGIAGDGDLQQGLEEAGLSAVVVHDAPAIPPEEIATAHSAPGLGYRAFAPYFERWFALGVASYESPLLMRFAATDDQGEPLPMPAEFGAGAGVVEAGPARARQVFDRFMVERAPQYATEGGNPSVGGTSELSAHLSFGTISARIIVESVRRRLADPFSLSEERLSLRLYLRALARRDFFFQLGWFFPHTADEPLQEKMRGFSLDPNEAGVAAWRAGATGFPLVDAGIRQLRETGWMHPLVRAVAASLLCFDLRGDWRDGREEWDRQLVEDDPAAATGNWQWIAGVGADMAQFPRIYNPERQRRRCDPNGAYVRRWVPELAQVPAESWHGRASTSPQLALALFDGEGYPPPIVDHAVAAREFIERYRAFVSL